MIERHEQRISAVVEGEEIVSHHSFWRGETTNFMPAARGMREAGALAKHVLAGWMPPAPFIDQDTTIVAFGSCFATHISGHLNNLGFRVETKRKGKAYVSEMGDGIVNTFAILQQFEWAWEARVPAVELWHGYKAQEFGYDEEVRLATRALFDAADVFILTLGLSEIWYDEPTGEVFWRAVPHDKFDPSRHKFRVASATENLSNLEKVVDLIRRHRPEAAIVLTLSPVPLSATFRPVSCVTANSVSKANLRSAVDELVRARAADAKLFYFPAYEVVTTCFRNPFERDLRHPLLHVLDVNLTAFERYFCQTGLGDADLEAVWLDALAKDQEVARLGPDEMDALAEERRLWRASNPSASLALEKRLDERRAIVEARREHVGDRQARIERRQAREQRRGDRDPA